MIYFHVDNLCDVGRLVVTKIQLPLNLLMYDRSMVGFKKINIRLSINQINKLKSIYFIAQQYWHMNGHVNAHPSFQIVTRIKKRRCPGHKSGGTGSRPKIPPTNKTPETIGNPVRKNHPRNFL